MCQGLIGSNETDEFICVREFKDVAFPACQAKTAGQRSIVNITEHYCIGLSAELKIVKCKISSIIERGFSSLIQRLYS